MAWWGDGPGRSGGSAALAPASATCCASVAVTSQDCAADATAACNWTPRVDSNVLRMASAKATPCLRKASPLELLLPLVDEGLIVGVDAHDPPAKAASTALLPTKSKRPWARSWLLRGALRLARL